MVGQMVICSNCTWYEEQITFSNGEMRLSIDQEVEGKSQDTREQNIERMTFLGTVYMKSV